MANDRGGRAIVKKDGLVGLVVAGGTFLLVGFAAPLAEDALGNWVLYVPLPAFIVAGLFLLSAVAAFISRWLFPTLRVLRVPAAWILSICGWIGRIVLERYEVLLSAVILLSLYLGLPKIADESTAIAFGLVGGFFLLLVIVIRFIHAKVAAIESTWPAILVFYPPILDEERNAIMKEAITALLEELRWPSSRIRAIDNDKDLHDTMDDYDVLVMLMPEPSDLGPYRIENNLQERILGRIEDGLGIVATHDAVVFQWDILASRAFGLEDFEHVPTSEIRPIVSPHAHPITEGIENIEIGGGECLKPKGEIKDHVQVLSANTGTEAEDFPAGWIRYVNRGRVFYLAAGHEVEFYQKLEVIKLLARAIRWAAGV